MIDASYIAATIDSRLFAPLEASELCVLTSPAVFDQRIHEVAEDLGLTPANVMGRLERVVRASDVFDADRQKAIVGWLHEHRTARRRAQN